MNETIEHIKNKYNLDLEQKAPLDIQEDRDNLAELFGELKFKKGAEIGVEQGKYSEVLCKANPGLKLYCIDAWEAYKGYRDHVRQEKLNRFLQITKERLSPYNCEIIKAYSMDAVKCFEDESLDFVYIDGNHDFINAAQDIWYWEKKVKKGGIISGHDYLRTKGNYTCDVVDVVNAYTYSRGIKLWFVYRGNRASSFMWVK